MLEEIGISIEEKFRTCIGEEWARKIAQNVLRAESITPPYEMSLVFTDSETVRRLNRDYRGIDEPRMCSPFICFLNKGLMLTLFLLPMM